MTKGQMNHIDRAGRILDALGDYIHGREEIDGYTVLRELSQALEHLRSVVYQEAETNPEVLRELKEVIKRCESEKRSEAKSAKPDWN